MAASQGEAMMKAYADVMLNMAQESAARVLAAERRAAVLEGWLAAAKEDGVAALVRLKGIMETRIKEVELRSLQQVKKIKELEEQRLLQHIKMKELEEQLYGAQNSVAALQFELQVANTELENTKNTLAEERLNCFPTSKTMDQHKTTSSSLKKNLQSGSMSFKNKKTAEETCVNPAIRDNGAVQTMHNTYRRSRGVPSFMERNNKLKLYHSGCSQRIHALKRRNQGADACREQNHKHATRLKSRSKVRKNDTAKNADHTRSIMEQLLETKFLGTCKRKRGSRGRPCYSNDSGRGRPCYSNDSSGESRGAEYKLPATSDGNGCLLLLKALEQDLSPLKVSAGHGGEAITDLKDDSLMNRSDAGLNLCADTPELIDLLAAKDMLVHRRKRSKTVRVLEADFSDSKSVSQSGNTLLRSTSEKSMSDTELISVMKDDDSGTPPGNNSPVLQHTNKNLMHQDDANNGKLDSGNSSALLLQSCKNEIMDYGNLLVEKLEHKAPDNNNACLKEANGEGSCNLASRKADASTDSLDKEESLKVSSGLPMQATEKPNALVGSSLYKEEHGKASGASMQVEGARQIKYTFNRRKRKGVSTDSTPLCAVRDKSSDLLSASKEGEPHPNAEPQDNLIDSPQGDNQLVQVAEQLILLSECN